MKKKKKVRYTDEPMEFEVIEDFLPPPDKLILKVDERKEDKYFAKIGEERLKTYSKKKALTDEEVWGKSKLKKGRGNKL